MYFTLKKQFSWCFLQKNSVFLNVFDSLFDVFYLKIQCFALLYTHKKNNLFDVF